MKRINKQIIEIMTGKRYQPIEKELNFSNKLSDNIEVFNHIQSILRREDKTLHLVTAPTGSGKTYIINEIFKEEEKYWTSKYENIREYIKNINLDTKEEQEKIIAKFGNIGQEIITIWNNVMKEEDEYFKKDRQADIEHFKLSVELKVLKPVILNLTCPAYLQNKQNESSYGFKPLVKGENINLNKKISKISSVYEKNEEISTSNARIITVIDEAHLITDSSTFRKDGINALREITKASQVTLMITATPLPLSIVKFDTITYITDPSYKMNVDKITLYKGDIQAITDYLLAQYNTKNALFRINSFNNINAQIEKYSNIQKITTEEKSFSNEDFSNIVNKSTLLKGCKLCTSLMDAGINLNTYEEDLITGFIALDKKHFNLDSIEQFANRTRGHLNEFIIAHNPSENKKHPTLQFIFKELYIEGLRYYKAFNNILEGLKLLETDKERIIARLEENLNYITVDNRKNNHYGSIYITEDLELHYDKNVLFKVCIDKYYQMLNEKDIIEEIEDRLNVKLEVKELDLKAEKKARNTDKDKTDYVRSEVVETIDQEDLKALIRGNKVETLLDIEKVKADNKEELEKKEHLELLQNEDTLLNTINTMLKVNIEYSKVIELVKDTTLKYSDLENYVIEEMYIRYNNKQAPTVGRTGRMYELIIDFIGNINRTKARVIKEKKYNELYELITSNGYKVTKKKLLLHLSMIYNISASQDKLLVPSKDRYIRITSFKKKH